MQPTKCEACGSGLEFRRESSTQGFYCKNCDWSLVTTYIPPIDVDDTVYCVRLSGGDFHNEAQIRAVAAASSLNFIAARKLLQQENPMVFEGDAPKVKQIRDSLINAGLEPEIFPQFKY